MRKLIQKDDLRSLILSVVINIIIILLIPGIKMPQREDGKISVGLVELADENKKISPKKQEEEKVIEEPPKIMEPKEKVIEEKPVEEPKKEVVQEAKKVEKKPLPEITPLPDIEVLVSPAPFDRKRPNTTTKEVVRKERVLEDVKSEERVEIVGAELERSELAEIETTPINSEVKDAQIVTDIPTGKDSGEGFIALASETDKLEGLPKGYKDVGSSDGNLTGRWDESNRMPTYPESAELKGRTGTVVLQVHVTEEGRVQRIDIKGSGVPELNRAIEEVARTWKIYLSKNGQRVYGDVTLEIPFRLLRGE